MKSGIIIIFLTGQCHIDNRKHIHLWKAKNEVQGLAANGILQDLIELIVILGEICLSLKLICLGLKYVTNVLSIWLICWQIYQTAEAFVADPCHHLENEELSGWELTKNETQTYRLTPLRRIGGNRERERERRCPQTGFKCLLVRKRLSSLNIHRRVRINNWSTFDNLPHTPDIEWWRCSVAGPFSRHTTFRDCKRDN